MTTANETRTSTLAPIISITPKAGAQIQKVAAQEGKQGYGLRVMVAGGGCSGLSYKLTMENQTRPDDKVVEEHGVKIYVDRKSAFYLTGTVLDFSDGLNGKGFVFANPNAKSTCGCGNSFSA
ncbi:MAG: iron-sulfur cluster assembly accessory protein [Dehalococcoidia bacterium]|nr:iron-sulfur cluster assembly accessory protein [Dehalococcoidia bacterium]